MNPEKKKRNEKIYKFWKKHQDDPENRVSFADVGDEFGISRIMAYKIVRRWRDREEKTKVNSYPQRKA